MPSTIKDIKEYTGLSLATISKYLNGGNVLPENRAKIEKAINELHYEVNEIARGLVTKKTKTVGILVFSITSPFSGMILHHVGQALRKKGYGMLIVDSCDDEEIERKNVNYLISKKVDGIIVLPVASKGDFLKPVKRAGIPVVLLDRALADSQYDCVRITNRKSTYYAMQELIKRNHKKIAVIASEREYTGRERFNGFMEAMRDAGLEVPVEYQVRGKHSIASGYNGMMKLLTLKNRPTAVFMSNYEITLGAMLAINESGLKSPDDISLLGFDDQLFFHVMQPQVYMVEQPTQAMGEKAVELLLKRINGETQDGPMELALGTSLHRGNSIKTL
ncbi:LacI family DNA-binding transcriptional regulator [Butyrivibrio sp. INlla21]|uniref:LacI family DNA-binding transcriptional regulator n=1 Tax=Butyrivibrio sp. INlla21 TaxID=1520811 RepID=UPI0008F13CF6|nr:LacI family DNA-binding transcriptional regulator [Butyrivibrio sp. INlla21]SFU86427.1 transcriptional regulator, LacI family [Butyrivibrio sp. INlla21]